MFPWMVLLALVTTGVVGCLAALAGQLYERRKWERRLLERVGSLDAINNGPARNDVARLELAVDAIAVELERVGEGQRFVTKLLSEKGRVDRTPPSPQPGAVRAIQPPTA